MEMGGFGLLNELCYVVPCLFVYLNVNYKAGFPFLSFRAPPGLLRLDDSLVYPRGAGTVGNDFLFFWCMLVYLCSLTGTVVFILVHCQGQFF